MFFFKGKSICNAHCMTGCEWLWSKIYLHVCAYNWQPNRLPLFNWEKRPCLSGLCNKNTQCGHSSMVCICVGMHVCGDPFFFHNFFSGSNQVYLNGGLIRTRDVNVSLSSYYIFPTYVSFEWMWAFSTCVTGRSLIRPSLTTQVTFEELLMDVFGTQPSYPLSPFPPSLCAFPCFNLRLD